VPQLQPGNVRVGLVGQEHLEAVAVVVGKAQLRAGVGVLTAAQHPSPVRPAVQVDPAGQLAHLGAGAGLPVGLDRGGPRRLGLREDRPADVGVDLHPQREPHALVAQVPGEPAAAAGAVGADQHRPLVAGALGQGEVDQLDQVGGVAGRGVARPQQARQRLAGGRAAVEVGQQRREPERSLVGAGRALLGVAVGGHQGRVGVDHQQPDLRVAAGRPGTGTGLRPGGP
jgi:hypothetical protein